MPCFGQFADVAADVLGGLRVDCRERLVEQDQQRLADQAAGDFEPALLAAGTAGRPCSCGRGSSRTARAPRWSAPSAPRVSELAGRALRLLRQRFQDGEDVLLDGQLAEDALFLRQVAHAEAGPAVHRQAW